MYSVASGENLTVVVSYFKVISSDGIGCGLPVLFVVTLIYQGIARYELCSITFN